VLVLAVHQLKGELNGLIDPRMKLSQANRRVAGMETGLEQTAMVYKALEKVWMCCSSADLSASLPN
jgi:hypothetical protein